MFNNNQAPQGLFAFSMRNKVLSMLMLLSVITFLDRVCMNVVAKYVKTDLKLNNEQFGFILGAFSLAYALFEMPTGWLGDRIGARKVLTRVVVWWSAFTGLSGLAFNFISLLITRFLFGAGEAGAYPNASIVISKWFPVQETGKAQSAIWAAARLGGSLTPLLVIPLTHALGWRASFGILAAVGLLWAMAWQFWFRDEPAQKSGITKAEVGLIESQRIVKKASQHLSFAEIFKHRNIWLLMLMCHLFFYASYFFTNWSNTYFLEGRKMTEEASKNFVSLSYFLGAAGCLMGGFLSDWLCRRYGRNIGRRSVAIVGLASSALFFYLAATTNNNERAGFLLAVCVLLKDLALPVAFATCIDIGRHQAGAVAGAMNFSGQMGGLFITLLFGSIVTRTNNYNLPLLLIAGCLVVSAICWLFIEPEKPLLKTTGVADEAIKQ
jgi:MFS transporter, ACS family, glucarate transporter